VVCYYPLEAWKTKNGVYFREQPDGSRLRLPCGRCIGCKLERSRMWASRLMHELRFHERSGFITLTYNDASLPSPPSLNPKHFQDFLKRLRKALYPRQIRFFHCGEYGEKKGRPHYHAILFGEDFLDDSFEHRKTPSGEIVWSSHLLSRLWPIGLHCVGSVTFESCAYVARYITKKINGPLAEGGFITVHDDGELEYVYGHYDWIDGCGKLVKLKPEYCTMSRRPAIGKRHFEKWKDEIYRDDCCIVRGKKMKPPKYYDKLLDKDDPVLLEKIKLYREIRADDGFGNIPSREQLCISGKVKKQQISTLRRRMEL
jgi:hypothetical protein